MTTPFTAAELATIGETFSLYRMTAGQRIWAWRMIVARWHATSGRFHAYASAHAIAAEAERTKA